MKRIICLTAIVMLLVSNTFGQSDSLKETKNAFAPALLVIDVQEEYMTWMSKGDQDLAIEMMNWAIWVFRQNNLPVIRVYHTDPEWGPQEGTPNFEFHDSLKVMDSDPKFIKNYPSAFTKTELDNYLKENEIKTLLLCGLSSTGCVLATYFDAMAYDYKAFMVKDALLSHKESYTDNIEEMFNALDLETIMYMLEVTKE